MGQDQSLEDQLTIACQQLEQLCQQAPAATNLSPPLLAEALQTLQTLLQTLKEQPGQPQRQAVAPAPAPAPGPDPGSNLHHYRNIQLQTAAEISKQASMILDPALLMFQAVNLIRDRFNFYYVGIFIWYKNTNQAVLIAGTGTAGQQMLLAGHQLEVGGNSMIGWCIANAKPRIALDVGKEAIHFDNPYLPETRSELALPLISRGQCIGALTVQSKEAAAFSDEDVTVLQSMADLLAISIENAWLYEAAQREITERKHVEEAVRQRNRELTMLYRASQAMISTLDLDETLNTVLEEVRRLLKVIASSVWLEEPNGELACRAATGPQKDTVRQWRLAPGEGFVGWVVRTGESSIVGNAQADPRHFHKLDEQAGQPLASILTIPLRVKNRVIGALQVVDTQPYRFNETDLTLLEPLAVTAAMAIDNARLYAQARQDAETKQALLREVNHRVKNNLSAIIGVLYAERRRLKGRSDTDTYESTMNDLIGRVQGLATVHTMLSASEWAPLPLSELANQVIHSSLRALPVGRDIIVHITPSPVTVTPDQAHNLALIINELTTNTLKQAETATEVMKIQITIKGNNEEIYFEFRDNGPGYPEEVLRLERHGVGLELLQEIVRKSLRGELVLYNDPGAVTVIRFKPEKQETQP